MFSSMFCGTFFMNSLAGITMQALLCHFVKPVTQLFKLHKLLYVFHTHGVSLPYPQATMFVCITLSDLYRGAPPPPPNFGGHVSTHLSAQHEWDS